MNILLLVVDSLRARSLARVRDSAPHTPFLDSLAQQTLQFQRAYATECWTLPTHCSIFTGLLPSEHGAHFHSMGYRGEAPTLAELLSEEGHHTEIVTRNSVFDGTLPGITRGFRENTRLFSDGTSDNSFALLLALAKPRFQRYIKQTGFFHPIQRESRRFLAEFARAMMPADMKTLDYTLDQMARQQREGRPYFIFCNLYDVHAPYPPTLDSILRPFRSWDGLAENLLFPWAMSRLGRHNYLRPDFHLGERSRRILESRYHRAIELMDTKLEEFYVTALGRGLLDDTLLILTSDHGEAFGEHGLYLHDASVYDTHLHVPLWIRHPERSPEPVNDVVSTRDLFGLMRAAGLGRSLEGTILDPDYRAEHPIALAEHFYYPYLDDILPRYRQNLVAALTGRRKVVLSREGLEHYDLAVDPDEKTPDAVTLEEFDSTCRSDGLPPGAVQHALDHMRRWKVNPSP